MLGFYLSGTYIISEHNRSSYVNMTVTDKHADINICTHPSRK